MHWNDVDVELLDGLVVHLDSVDAGELPHEVPRWLCEVVAL